MTFDTKDTVTGPLDEKLLDSIVAGVLDRLRKPSAPQSLTSGKRPPSENETQLSTTPRAADAARSPVVLSDRVVTESILEAKRNDATVIHFAPKAVLTPSARDYLRRNAIEWAYAEGPQAKSPSTSNALAVLVVRATPAVESLIADLLASARKEVPGCPDDAAALAISEISRGGFTCAILFTEQTHRAACLANRHTSVKAVAVRDANDVRAVRQQLRANVWCVDPTGRSRFELMNVVKAIVREKTC